MTRFEKTRVISARALQLSMGAPILIKTKSKTPRIVAKEEYNEDVLPIISKTRKTAKTK
ncbi:DNA-directed RNA polymerase subunit K [archaeon]|nr:DNA-directed RNA polymerase subunit K [archaeon]|tara:strand:- start:2642 stop:2818 length:177 start_codon:yes stop_codon:yes gene_type:complete